ncbi:hypothetical protein [Actinomarinicola tropica]|uniref:Uncharacterized protein n=1 Tax=Actinomarinicola tropica TaxID=2789776 RepID=A0A5Q2RUC8_9ACTN|nr:hypothetical protein [Actinomarinicola tropica]QGG96815.1 hypothetical protein GH723_17875 [Actinomarinicola tropica]
MRARVRHLTIAGAAGAMLLAGACGEAAERVGENALEAAIESESGADVDLNLDDDGAISVETEDGSFSMGQTEIPDDWPSDVPLPPDLETQTVSQQSDATSGEATTLVMGTTGLEPAQVAELYADALSGWDETVNSTTSADGSTTVNIGFERPDRDSVVVMATNDGTGTFVTVMYGIQTP